MRSLDEIVTRNALRFIADAKKRAAKDGLTLSEFAIAGRMAEAMGANHKSVSKQLGRYLYEGHTWRVDYVEALAVSVGRSREDMVAAKESGKADDATVTQLFYNTLRHRLSSSELRAVVKRTHHVLNHRPRFELSGDLMDAIIAAKTKDNAIRACLMLIEKSLAWDRKGLDHKFRQKSRQIVSRKA